MPQRFLRPGLRNSDHWNKVSFKAQSLFVRLLTLVDDFGRFDGRPSVICGECFSVWNELHPDDIVTPQDSAALSCELQAENLVEIYETEGKKVLQLLQWQERARSDKSKWPDKSVMPLRNPAESCGILPPSPSPSPVHPRSSPSPAHLPEPNLPEQHGHATIAQVLVKAQFIGMAEWKARDWFDEMEGCGWLDFQHRPIKNWESVMVRVCRKWEADGRPSKPPVSGNQPVRKRRDPTL